MHAYILVYMHTGPSKPSKPHPEEPSLPEGGEGVVAPNAFRGTFTKDLRVMQYGYGDDELPLQETVSVAVCWERVGSVSLAVCV